MPGKIFVNYRRGDDPGFTQALYQRLEDEFPAGDLFMDVEGHIKPGDDFVEVLRSQVAACDVLLAVIGPRWAELLAARLSETDDFVGIEIKAALDQGKRVIPVLVGGAGMPRADALPAAIRPLARRNAVGLRPERFKTDCQGLVTALKEHLAAAERERAARTEAERAAAEAGRQKREAEEAARIAAAEERARAQAMAGLSAEEIRKAEELANWDFVKDRNDIQDLRDHLARFPAGTTERYALARLDGLVWAALGPSPGVDRLRDYLDEFPTGAHTAAAQARIDMLERRTANAKTARSATAGAIPSASERLEPARPQRRDPSRHGGSGLWPNILLGAGATVALVLLAVLAYQRQAPVVAKPDPPPQTSGKDKPDVALSSPAPKVKEPKQPVAIAPPEPKPEVAPAVKPAVALTAAEERALKPKDSFKECDVCPEMVVVPAGRFMMGSSPSEIAALVKETKSEHFRNEGPQRQVTIARPFAVGKFEVTFAEFDACVADGGCNHRPDDFDWGRGSRPVIIVSWHDAKEYAAWLAHKTGKTYRLLSEAEWEYAARAGTTTRSAFGDTITESHVKVGGRRTMDVGSFPANKFGLHDMHGNVWEWVEDTWHPDYRGAPDDGSVWPGGDTSLRVTRGGSWGSSPQFLRSAGRISYQPTNRSSGTGFRVARTL